MFKVAKISAADKIPFFQKMAFSMGSGTDYISTQLITSIFWLPFFNIGLGINPMLASAALIVMQVCNAIVDPLMGNLSDNARTPWGRRRPFMFVGAFLTAVMYAIIWHVPINGDSGFFSFFWLAGIGIVHSVCFAIWAMPYFAMQLELTPNYDERTRLMAWGTFLKTLSALVCGWGMWLVTRPIFSSKEAFFERAGNFFENITDFSYLSEVWLPFSFADGESNLVNGVRLTSFLIAAVILVLGIFPALFCKERYYGTKASSQSKDPFWTSIRESGTCYPLWMLIGVSFFLVVGSSSMEGMWHYINIYYVFGGDIAKASMVAGFKYSTFAITGVLLLPLLTWLGERFDKKTIVYFMLCLTMVGHITNFVFIRQDMPYLQILPGVFEMGAISSIWLFIPSMKADVADYDELHTTRRREGSINAFYSWFIKVSLATAAGTTGALLTLSGFSAETGAQSEGILKHMFLLYIGIPILLFGIGVVFVHFYPINRVRANEIRAKLEAKRGKL